MLVQTKNLQYWKTEHKDLNGCQDAYALAAEHGIFVVADGAGTTLFPAIWARILARHFVEIPLMSDNPFEVEWWVRLAQEQYKVQLQPVIDHLTDSFVIHKAQTQGSDSTLATVRISAVNPASAQAELLVFGDSCVIIGNKRTNEIEKSFVLQNPADFNRAPICVPSNLRFFNRNFHRCTIESFTLQPHHIVILATDAVSKWILSGGSGGSRHAEPWDAFQEVCRQLDDSWPDFITRCRDNKEMVDDDSTVLILTFKEDGPREGMPLGSTTAHSRQVVSQRKEAFQKAQKDQNNELVAIYYGDGKDLKPLVEVTSEEIEHAQKVADALKEVLRAFRQALNSPDLVAKVEPVWQQYGRLLQNERCAENICNSLRDNGVNLTLPEQRVPPLPATPPAGNVISPSIELASQTDDTAKRPPAPPPAMIPKDVLEAQEKKDLELIFFKALRGDHGESIHDEAILTAADALAGARSRYPDLPQFSKEEEQRIELARKRLQAKERLKRALQSGFVEEIAMAYDPTLTDAPTLTLDERERIKLACRLVEAYANNDDETILTTYQQVRYRSFFTFTRQDEEQIEAAQRRLQALVKFQVALGSGSLQQIAAVYDPTLDNSKRVTESERQLLALAQEFVAACTDNDDDAIVAAYEKIKISSYMESIAFTPKENSRIQQAEGHVETVRQTLKTIIATMNNGVEITLYMLRMVCSIKGPYIHKKIRDLQQQWQYETDAQAKQALERHIQQLSVEIDQHHLSLFALDDIIDDVLIRRKIREEKQQRVPLDDMDVDGQLPSFITEFKQFVAADYDALLKNNRLTEEEVERVLRLYLRRKLFAQHFRNQQKLVPPKLPFGGWQKPMQLDEWLKRQRRDAEVTYTKYNSNAEQRNAWLSDLLQQAK